MGCKYWNSGSKQIGLQISYRRAAPYQLTSLFSADSRMGQWYLHKSIWPRHCSTGYWPGLQNVVVKSQDRQIEVPTKRKRKPLFFPLAPPPLAHFLFLALFWEYLWPQLFGIHILISPLFLLHETSRKDLGKSFSMTYRCQEEVLGTVLRWSGRQWGSLSKDLQFLLL